MTEQDGEIYKSEQITIYDLEPRTEEASLNSLPHLTTAELEPTLALPAARAGAGEAQGERRVAALVGALLQRRVFSRARLAAEWERDPEFMRAELAAWLRKVSTFLTRAKNTMDVFVSVYNPVAWLHNVCLCTLIRL